MMTIKIQEAARLIKASRRILVVAGAGISVSCGIPDFRSPGGLYSQLRKQFPSLIDPKLIFDLDFFKNNPIPFYRVAKVRRL